MPPKSKKRARPPSPPDASEDPEALMAEADEVFATKTKVQEDFRPVIHKIKIGAA